MKKDLAKTIRETRTAFKAAQRELSKIELDATFHNRSDRELKTQSIKDNINYLKLNLDEYSRQYRIRHILTCMLKGKSISQIEMHTGNDEQSIKIRNKIYETVKWHLDMCDERWIG